MTDEYYMTQAIKEARKAMEEEEIPVGAVVVMDGKIIARGHNMVERLNDPTAHAEMIALTAAFNSMGSKSLSQATLYITVEPCLMCAGALYWSKIGKIVYGADDEKNGYKKITSPIGGGGEGAWPFHPKTQLIHGVMKEECAKLMTDFFKSKR